MIRLLVLLGIIAAVAYKLYENSKVDTQVSHIDHWQETAKHMIPVPLSHVELNDPYKGKAPGLVNEGRDVASR
jgi:hypothetical protein